MRNVLTLFALFTAAALHAQLDMPVRVVLDAPMTTDRQVRGLADPLTSDAAVSVDAARAGTMSYLITTGTMAMTGDATPAPSTFLPGMAFTILPDAANEAGATLEVNGSGAFPLLKWGQLPLDSADLRPGVPARVIFNGSAFLVTNSVTRPCAKGTHPASALYCISDSAVGTGTFFESVTRCAALGGRNCTYGEWARACRLDVAFLGTVSGPEWVDDAANNSNDSKVVGAGSNGPGPIPGFACEYGNTREPLLTFPFRCCFDR